MKIKSYMCKKNVLISGCQDLMDEGNGRGEEKKKSEKKGSNVDGVNDLYDEVTEERGKKK